MRFTFAVISDSHFHLPHGDPQSAYPSDAIHNDRNRAVVRHLNELAPAFVVHCGDVPHPVPGIAEHAPALAVAVETYAPLRCPIHVVAGNHDVGDKPHPWAPAPSVDDAKHAVFEATWGPAWRAFEHEGWRFLLLDVPLLGSGLERERQFRAWFEAEAAKGGRQVWFTHYPPYLLHPDEAEHYDNLAPPARAWLLDLARRWKPVAWFAGHVHHFFWDRYDDTELWVAPATSFVRPEYSELSRIGPGEEFGRDEPEKLGFYLVHVDGDTLDVQVIRGVSDTPTPRSRCPVVFDLRHAWDAVQDVPYGNLDEFVRKSARNDLVVFALWEVGATVVRVPVGDLRDRRERMEKLAQKGMRFLVFSVGDPAEDRALIEGAAHLLHGWEVVAPWRLREQIAAAIADVPVRTWLSITGGGAARFGPEPKYFSHFRPHGFEADEARPERPIVLRGTSAGVVAKARAGDLVRLESPRGAEGEMFVDEDALGEWIVAAAEAARERPDVTVVVDTLLDHDRGYFPRIGLLDRRCLPRAPWRRLLTWGRA